MKVLRVFLIAVSFGFAIFATISAILIYADNSVDAQIEQGHYGILVGLSYFAISIWLVYFFRNRIKIFKERKRNLFSQLKTIKGFNRGQLIINGIRLNFRPKVIPHRDYGYRFVIRIRIPFDKSDNSIVVKNLRYRYLYKRTETQQIILIDYYVRFKKVNIIKLERLLNKITNLNQKPLF